tara:strand:- start:580 stop:1965 length:1386 start_codon:yes stop_codon:yes gene_type:complete
MQSVFMVLEELGSTSKRKEKISIIEKHKDSDMLKQVFKHALDPFHVYGIRAVPEYEYTGSNSVSLQDFIDFLPDLMERKITGHAALDKLSDMLSNMSAQDSVVAERIITKDLRCGVQGSTVNKVWENFIFSYPCLLGKSFDPDTINKHMTWPAIAQLKLDGLRVNAIVNSADMKVELFTRAGKPINIHNRLDADLCHLHVCDDKETPAMYDGELLVVDNAGNVLPRKAGNGILNKAIRGTISFEEACRVRIQLWDRVPLIDFYKHESSEPYKMRFQHLLDAAEKATGDETGTLHALANGEQKFKVVDYRYVNTLDEAQDYYQEALANGEEGIMLKTITHLWSDKRSNELVKFKCEKLCELKVVDWLEGTGKYTGYLGKLTCVSEDGMLEVNVGSGFSDQFRHTTKPEDIIGKVITVKFNEVIDSEDKPGKYSLFLGRFIEVRDDKDVADDIATIQATKTVK